MEKIIFIFEGAGKVNGMLDRNLNPETVEAILKALPINSTANTWGDEIYFSTHIKAKQEKAKTDLSVGDVTYYPPSQSICLFFGPTPASKGKEPRAAGPVNVVGKLSDLEILRKVKDGCRVNVVKG